jgi:predicted nucleotidyltransferase
LVAFGSRSPRGYAAAFLGLKGALEERTGRSVDMLTELALANPYLRARIEAGRRQLFP